MINLLALVNDNMWDIADDAVLAKYGPIPTWEAMKSTWDGVGRLVDSVYAAVWLDMDERVS